MAYFKEYIVSEYAKGNYVVVGGDWNQIPPGYTPLNENSDYEEMPVRKILQIKTGRLPLTEIHLQTEK